MKHTSITPSLLGAAVALFASLSLPQTARADNGGPEMTVACERSCAAEGFHLEVLAGIDANATSMIRIWSEPVVWNWSQPVNNSVQVGTQTASDHLLSIGGPFCENYPTGGNFYILGDVHQVTSTSPVSSTETSLLMSSSSTLCSMSTNMLLQLLDTEKVNPNAYIPSSCPYEGCTPPTGTGDSDIGEGWEMGLSELLHADDLAWIIWNGFEDHLGEGTPGGEGLEQLILHWPSSEKGVSEVLDTEDLQRHLDESLGQGKFDALTLWEGARLAVLTYLDELGD